MAATELDAGRRVVELLRTFNEARIAWDGRSGGDGWGGMPSMWNEGSYAELERCLAFMRESPARQQWWHVCMRYRWGEVRTIRVSVRKEDGQRVLAIPHHCELVAGAVVSGSRTGTARVYTWSTEVDELQVARGVETLVAIMYGGRQERIWLPESVYDRVMGREMAVA